MLSFKGRIRAAICVGILYLSGGSIATSGTLLPNGMQYFTDNNGLPLSAGCVYFFVPGTMSPKATYQDSGQTIANTNPVQLDAAGRAIIYGTGTYRQIVKASNGTITPCSPAGTQIWDQLTASTDSSTTIFAGASAGTPNAVTVNAPAFSGTDGQVINYISTNTNTSGATFNPSGFGAIPIVRDGSTGPAALTGGELVATNAVSLIYDATAGTFHILSPVTWPASGGVPVGTVVPFPGFTAPSGYAFAYGQAISRTTFASLFTAYTLAQSGSISSGSPTITGLTDTTQFGRGVAVESVGIPASTTLLSCDATTCTMNANATSTRTGTMTFLPYGSGDGSTTFNLPDYRGVGLTGRDNMGGSAANTMQATTTITTTISSASATLGTASGAAVGMFVISANVPSGTTITALNGTTITLSAVATASAIGTAVRISQFNDAQSLAGIGGARTKSLLATELPSSIPFNDPGHTHTVNYPAATSTIGGAFPYAGSANAGTLIGTALNSSTGITINPSGGQAFAAMIPHKIINWAVRITP
jgi:microcystin-dependent protein